ncbi:hypothetical protein BGX28_001665, partial [Mortierella sp. GBA30]
MLRNTMTDSSFTLFCLVDGVATSKAFPVDIKSSKTIGDLKKLIKAEQSPDFDDIVANNLTLWRVSVPDVNQGFAITIDALDDKMELNNPRTRLSKLFPEGSDDDTYVIVQRPPPVHAPAPARAFPGYPSDDSRPGTPLSGEKWHELAVQIENRFFAKDSINYTSLAQLLKA